MSDRPSEPGGPDAAIHVEVVWLEAPGGSSVTRDGLGEPAYGVVTAPTSAVRRLVLALPSESTLATLLACRAMAVFRAELDSGALAIAVFGRAGRSDMPLYDGDRIELLGPVTADPKLARRRRVERARAAAPSGRWRRS
ncbi:MAG: RnfH family protein [Burkholderiaceae bacterium]|nr:RnfH family protein [Burkholderiaceae bacterium]